MKVQTAFFIILFSATAAQADTVKLCTMFVDMDGYTHCTSGSGWNSGPEWGATCGGVHVTGIAHCSQTSATYTGDMKSNINVFVPYNVINGSNASPYCWCKMTYPAISWWTFAGKLDGTLPGKASWNNCERDCPVACKEMAVGNSYGDSLIMTYDI